MPNKSIRTLRVEDFQIGDTIVARIQNRRGNRVNLPQPLQPGELGWCLDTKQLFIGLSEENSVSGIEIYRVGVLNAQSLTTEIIDQQLIEFDTKWVRLNRSVNLKDRMNEYVNEETLLASLREVPATVYVDSQKRSIVSRVEDNIEIISTLNNQVLESLRGSYIDPNTSDLFNYDFRKQALITYDWVKEYSTACKIRVETVSGGVITGISIKDPGLGYVADTYGSNVVQLYDKSTTNGAIFSGEIDAAKEGILTGVFIILGGSNYTVGQELTLTAPVQTGITATAGTIIRDTVGNGALLQVTVGFKGHEYAEHSSPEVVIVDSGGGTGAEIEAYVLNGEVVVLSIVKGGSGYSDQTQVYIAPPKSDYLYKFKYDVGVDDQDSVRFSDPGLAGVRLEDYNKLLNSIAYLSAVDQIISVGVLGRAPSNDGDFYPRDNMMISGLFYLDTPRQSSNVAAIINTLTKSSTGIVTSKQNVELLTEFSANEEDLDTLITDLLTYELTPTNDYLKVTNDAPSGTGQYSSPDLEYNVLESDNQSFDYTVHLSNPVLGYSSSGRLLVITNPKVDVVSQTRVSDSSTEVRGDSIARLDEGGPDISFTSIYKPDRRVVELYYRHNFPSNVILKVLTKRWLSY